MKRAFDNSVEFCTLLSSVKDGSIVILEALLRDTSLKQDEIVVAYIEALELGKKEVAELLKKYIKHYNEKTDFDYSVPETIALYALLLRKNNAFSELKKEVGSDFYIPILEVFLLSAARYGYVGMMECAYSYLGELSSEQEKRVAKAAVHSGNVDALELVISTGEFDTDDINSLFRCSLKGGKLELAQYLESKGADDLGSALDQIALNGHIHVLRYLMQRHNADCEDILQTVYMYANAKLLKETEEILPIDPAQYNDIAERAVLRGDVGALQYIVSKGFDLEGNKNLLMKDMRMSLDPLKIMIYLRSCGADVFKIFDESYKSCVDLETFNYLREQNINFDYMMSKFWGIRVEHKGNYGWLKNWPVSVDKPYMDMLMSCAIVWQDLESLKHLVKLGFDVKSRLDHFLNDAIRYGNVEIFKYLFSLDEAVEQSIPQYLSIASAEGRLEIFKYLHAKCGVLGDLSGELIKDAVSVKRSENVIHFQIVQYICSQGAVQLKPEYIDLMMKCVFSECGSEYHVLACTNLGSLYAEHIRAHTAAEDMMSEYHDYSAAIERLSVNVNPCVRLVNPLDLDGIRDMRAKFIKIFEMFYCAVDCPTEVLCLIANQMLGFEFDATAVNRHSYLANVILPRDSEVEMRYNAYTCESKQATIMYLLYMHNQQPSVGM